MEKDPCIMGCGRDTGYTKDVHIDVRRCYVEGAGQLCPGCYKNTYKE